MNLTNMNYNNDNEIEPELNLNVSITFYVIQWLLFFPTIYINVLVFKMANRESLSISLELKSVSIIYILASVGSVIYQAIIKFTFPASLLIGDWFCQTTNVLMSAVMLQQLIATFTISLYRYVFIIYREKYTATEKIQKKVTWAIFVGKTILLLVMTAKFVIFNHKYLFVKVFTSVCNGDILRQESEIERIHNLTGIEYFKEHLSYDRSGDENSLSTIFGNVENQALVLTLQIFCGIIDLFVVMTCCNLTEGFMYYGIAKFWKG